MCNARDIAPAVVIPATSVRIMSLRTFMEREIDFSDSPRVPYLRYLMAYPGTRAEIGPNKVC